MKKIRILFIMAVLVFACKESGVIERPDDLIEKQKMEDVLYQIAILNAAKSIPLNNLENEKIELAPYVYQQFGIDSLQFAKSSVYYASHPDTDLEIYQNVEKRLQAYKDKIKEENDIETKKRDSLFKAKNRKIDSKGKPKPLDTLALPKK
ncbi:DUF4296 domain-containing protein [Zhouia sp. PK063]|uniref:DUF4296 domain-containing protein n=1 Tax=Zhouia sp. PK063 TaxID=3373602 RepID=UPI00379BE503